VRLYRHPLPAGAFDLAALRAAASRHGVLLESSTQCRAGFGDVLREVIISDETVLPAALFEGFDVATDDDLGGFGLVPFEPDLPRRGWVSEHTVTTTGEHSVLTSPHATSARAMATLASEVAPRVGGDPLGALTYAPSPDAYAASVADVVTQIRRGVADKVVLGRRATGELAHPVDAGVVAARLGEREPACTIYAVPLPTGRYVGASPELLISVLDGSITARPLAGTVALADAPEFADGSWLLGSTKNLFEHRVVVEDVVARLTARCLDVDAETTPSVVALRSVAHLGTWIRAKVDPTAPVTSTDLLAALHPTPAVGGRPLGAAAAVIARTEGVPRDHFAGAVGWLDRAGNGEWWIAIRGVALAGRHFTAWAGAGIVADSDPVAEREETRAKLEAILVGLGPLA
jgi:isochorismate synthase